MPYTEIIFWLSGFLLFYAYFGYAVLIFLLVKASEKKGLSYLPSESLPQGRACSPNAPTPGRLSDASLPLCSVTVILVVHNEASRIAQRLQNLFDSRIYGDHLAIIVVSDGSTDATAQIAREFGNDRITVLELPEPAGKANGINRALPLVQSDFVVFTDARQTFAPDTITHLVAPFVDANIGAVTGELQLSAVDQVGKGLDFYWRLEKFIRRSEAQWDSCIGCTGAVYATRTALIHPLPPDTILDDVVIPMRIACQGSRVIVNPAAIAIDPQLLSANTDKLRKQRTIAGNFQLFFRYTGWLLPWKNRLFWQLFSHKYLRLFSPLFLLAFFLSNLALWDTHWGYRTLFLGQFLFYLAGIIGRRWPGSPRLFALPAGFLFLNQQIVSGFLGYWRGKYHRGWRGNVDCGA